MPSTDVTEVTLLGGSVTVEAPAALPGATHVDAPSLPSSEEPDSDHPSGLSCTMCQGEKAIAVGGRRCTTTRSLTALSQAHNGAHLRSQAKHLRDLEQLAHVEANGTEKELKDLK